MEINASVAVIVLAPGRGGDVFLVERALQSVFAQTLQPPKVIVIEYGNNLISRMVYYSMFYPHSSRIKHFRYLGLESASVALQMGLAHVDFTVRVVAVIGPDFVWRPTFLEKMREAWLVNNEQAGLVYSDETGEDMFGERVDWLPIFPDYDRQRLFEYGHIHLPAATFNYQALLANGGFDNLAAGVPDWDVSLRLSKYGVQHIAEPLVHHYWWQSKNIEPLMQAHYAKNIAARINAGVYGPDAAYQLQNWQADQTPAMRSGAGFTRYWQGDAKS